MFSASFSKGHSTWPEDNHDNNHSFGKKYKRLKNFLEFIQNLFGFLLANSGHICQNCILDIEGNILKKEEIAGNNQFFWKNPFLSSNFWDFWQKTPTWMTKHCILCVRTKFLNRKIFWSNNISVIDSGLKGKISRLLSKKSSRFLNNYTSHNLTKVMTKFF